MLRVIHISDFHLESSDLSYEKSEIIDSLMKDLKDQVNESTLVFFTGDLIDKGGIGFGSERKDCFDWFQALFLDRITENLPSLKGKIFVVPGNHDVFRDKIDIITDNGIKSSLKNTKDLNEFLVNNRKESRHLDRISDYKLWEEKFYNTYQNKHLSNFGNNFIVELNNHKIGISCFNSSWLCKDDKDKEVILVGKNQIENSLDILKACDVKLALLHHPLEFFKDFDRDSFKIDLFKNYDVAFAGHVHELDTSYTQNLYGEIFISIANSTIADNPTDRRYINVYTILDLLPKENIKVYYRKYLENHKCFVPNTDVGTQDGTQNYTIKKESLIKFNTVQRIVEYVKEQHLEKLNEHIIISNSAKANISIENLFVEPDLLNYPEGMVKEEDIEKYSIESLLLEDSNFLIYGVKESGKTILMDKILIEALDGINRYNKVPVLLKFSELKKKTLSKAIREFLGISSSEYLEFIDQNNIIILIDDLNFNDTCAEQILELQKLINDKKNIQIIATIDQILDNVFPTNYLKYNDKLNFKVSFIQSWNSGIIKKFISKWFVDKDIDLQDKMEKLMKSFADFGLPKTPLSVTLFLWIFERQEKKPINNSVLVEIFVENILEKTNLDNIYSETFDFKNKQKLIAFIARYMHDNGDSDLSYCVDYVKLLSYVDEYLKVRFPGQPQKVLDDLLLRGIFSYEEGNRVRFKSAFFFHYFLALYFDYDKGFKLEVFSGEKYLDYIEEIVYYTGLKRDDVGVLKFTQDKLLEAFGEYQTDLIENYKRIDEVLEMKNSSEAISFQIDDDKINNKPTEEQIEEVYDAQLAHIPVKKDIPKKELSKLNTTLNKDKVLKLSALVLKNSEDVDDFKVKQDAYRNVLLSSIAFLMQYRDYLISYYIEFEKQPEHFPKNIDFHLFIRVLPLMHQIIVFNWLGSQKLRPIIVDKIEQDKLSLTISELEKFMSIYIYADIKGSGYPEVVREFVKGSKKKYIKDLSFLKIISYYHLRSKDVELDKFYLTLMSEIKEELGHLHKTKKSEFVLEMKQKKRNKE